MSNVTQGVTAQPTSSIFGVVSNAPSLGITGTIYPPAPDGAVDISFSHVYLVNSSDNNAINWTWSVASGTIPAGCALSPTTGQLAGTPTTATTYTYTVQADDSAAATTVTLAESVTITAETLNCADDAPDGQVGTVYGSPTHTFSPSGGTGPYTFGNTTGLSGSGLSLSSAGVLSGTPTNIGTYTIDTTITDSAAATLAFQSIIMIIAESAPGAPQSPAVAIV